MATVAEAMTQDGTAAHARSDATRSVVARHYEVDLDRPLGSGGMAVVYRGRDLRTRREVALKTLRPEYRKDPDTRAKFRREARTTAFLAHPNVIRVYDLFEDDDAPWAVLEYAPGNSLKEEIAQRGPFSVEETAQLLEQMANALDHLHGRGLVHLDVKPQNLIITPERTVKLIDFGLAQHAGEPQERIGGTAFGTAAYLSPEQACGEPVDAATDVYALGCVVYEMLAGQAPFGADGTGAVKTDVIRAHLEEEPEPPSSHRPLPAWVDDVVLHALAKKPRDRYRDCRSFARVFWAGLDDLDGPADTATRTLPLATPAGVDAVLDLPPAQRGPSVGGKVIGSFYRTGGRVARHTGWLQVILWRATLALFVGNLLLAALLYADRGEIPGVLAGEARMQRGATAVVATERLMLRAEPGRDSLILGVLVDDQRVRVTGDSLEEGGETWWPVRATVDGRTMDGYAAGDWLQATSSPKDVWLQRAKDEAASWPGRLLDRVTDR